MLIIMFLLLSQIVTYAENMSLTFDISAQHIYAIKDDNALWVWDIDKSGEIKNPHSVLDDVQSIQDGYAITTDRTLWECEDGIFGKSADNKPAKVMDNVKSISVGNGFALIVKTDNTLWGVGYNDCGQLGIGIREDDSYKPYQIDKPQKIMNNVLKTSIGDRHSVVLKTDGSVITFGDNLYGQLGQGVDIESNNHPVKITENIADVFAGEESTVAITENGSQMMCGTVFGAFVGKADKWSIYTLQQIDDNIKQTAIHYKRSLVLKTDDTLWQYSYWDDTDMPPTQQQVSENINSISGYLESEEYKTLVLDNSGDLYIYDLDVGGFTFKEFAENVKLPKKAEDDPQRNFSDIVKKNNETQKSINSLTKAGIISGTSETEFSPDKPITRAEIAALLLRMTAKNDEDGNGEFTDVTSDAWYYNTAGASKKYNIIAGFEDNTFRGDETISKVQLISLAARTLRNEERVTDAVDVADINAPEWAINDLSLALQEGLISENDLKDMEGSMTRADAAVILYKLYEKI